MLDIKKPEGLEALQRLIAKADVFVVQRPPRRRWPAPGSTMRAWRRCNPRLIHCSHPRLRRAAAATANRPAYDPVIQSLSGVAGTFARATGEPRFVPMVMTDHISGLIAAQAIGFALYRREKTGQGEAIDVPMFENMALAS